MDTLLIHALNALLYASVMFLIAGGLSLIYGVMRIVNLAHGNLYAFGAYVAAWAAGLVIGHLPVGLASLALAGGGVAGPVAGHLAVGLASLALAGGAVAAAALGAVLEPTLLRPLYRRAEEYQ